MQFTSTHHLLQVNKLLPPQFTKRRRTASPQLTRPRLASRRVARRPLPANGAAIVTVAGDGAALGYQVETGRVRLRAVLHVGVLVHVHGRARLHRWRVGGHVACRRGEHKLPRIVMCLSGGVGRVE